MKVTEEGIEIYFFDLNAVAQRVFLKALHVQFASEGNFDIVPIAVVPIPEK